MNGLQVAGNLRQKLHREIPVIILSGDISREFLRDIAGQNCTQLTKPIKSAVLTELIERLLPPCSAVHHWDAPANAEIPGTPGPPMIFIVDDDSHIRALIRRLLEENGQIVADYATCRGISRRISAGSRGLLVGRRLLAGNAWSRVDAAVER